MDQLQKTTPKIIIREVWGNNLNKELALIYDAMFSYRFVSIDTEYPGTIFHLSSNMPKQAYACLLPSKYYSLMKQNVDALHLIQLGLTLSDEHGNLPNFGTSIQYVWQFNFRDFDPDIHPNNPESISLLRTQGIDFEECKKNGIDSRMFAMRFSAMLLHLNRMRWLEYPHKVNWITFQGSYDFAYLIKILIGCELPVDLKDFMGLMHTFFGMDFYDLKIITKFLKIYGGLERIRTSLDLDRVVGMCHQAGSDSLMMMQVFMEVKKKYSRKLCELKYGLSSK